MFSIIIYQNLQTKTTPSLMIIVHVGKNITNQYSNQITH